MDNPRPEKVAVVEEVRERLSSSSAAILTEYRGLAVKDLSALRRSLTDAGGDYKIYKNTLVRFAARDLGLEELEAMLTGPTAIAFVDGDAVAVAKALRDFARTNPALIVKGGLLGTSVLSGPDAAALADLPSREVLLARIAGGLAAPMVKFAGLLQALPRNFAYGLKALIDQKGGVPEDSPAAADDPAAGATDTAPATEAPPAAEAAPAPESPPEAVLAEPEPEAVLADPEPEPEAVLAEPEPEPEAVLAEPEPESPAAEAAPAAPEPEAETDAEPELIVIVDPPAASPPASAEPTGEEPDGPAKVGAERSEGLKRALSQLPRRETPAPGPSAQSDTASTDPASTDPASTETEQ